MVATAAPGATESPACTGTLVMVPAQGAVSTSTPAGPRTLAISCCSCTASPALTATRTTTPPLRVPTRAWARACTSPRAISFWESGGAPPREGCALDHQRRPRRLTGAVAERGGASCPTGGSVGAARVICVARARVTRMVAAISHSTGPGTSARACRATATATRGLSGQPGRSSG